MMSHEVGKTFTAINTGYGCDKMWRGGEVVCPWMPADKKGFSSSYSISRRSRGGNTLVKGSPEAKARMAYLRSLRGKGVRGRGVDKKDRLIHALRKRGLPVSRSLILEGKSPLLRGKGFEWDDSYTNAALRGGDVFESYTNAALLGGDLDDAYEGLSGLFSEAPTSTSDLSSIYNAIGPAMKQQIIDFAAKQGRDALAYVSDPKNMQGIFDTLMPKVIGGLKKLWGKITGKKKTADNDMMALLRRLKQTDPAAYKQKILELAEVL